MWNMKNRILMALVALVVFVVGCGPDRTEKLKNGISYAKGALQQIGVNPLATATYQSIAGSGGGPAKYVNYMLPKTDPVWDSFEDGKPSHPWTIVIRPTAIPNEFSIEGFGDDVKKPIIVEYVTIKAPESE
jgi:hypothetical protein